MKKTIIIILTVVFVSFITGWVFVNLKDENTSSNDLNTQEVSNQQDNASDSQSISENQSESPNIKSEPTANSGQYIDFDQKSFDSNRQSERILFFYASWCPKCRALEADINKNGVPSGKTIFKVDFDNSQDLKQKYGVTLQTTLVKVDSEGNQISKYVAYDNPTLNNALSNL